MPVVGITEREAARQRKEARIDRDREFRRKGRERLKELRAHLRHAKRYRSERLRQVRKLCRRARIANRARVRELRAELRRRANLEVAALREYARGACESRKDQARKRSEDALARASHVLKEEQTFQDQVKHATDKPRRTRSEAARVRVELQREHDDTVRAGIPRELLPVWERVKGKIHESPRRTRTEAFLEWAEENAGDVRRILDESYEADVARLVAEERELGRAMRSGRAQAVPF